MLQKKLSVSNQNRELCFGRSTKSFFGKRNKRQKPNRNHTTVSGLSVVGFEKLSWSKPRMFCLSKYKKLKLWFQIGLKWENCKNYLSRRTNLWSFLAIGEPWKKGELWIWYRVNQLSQLYKTVPHYFGNTSSKLFSRLLELSTFKLWKTLNEMLLIELGFIFAIWGTNHNSTFREAIKKLLGTLLFSIVWWSICSKLGQASWAHSTCSSISMATGFKISRWVAMTLKNRYVVSRACSKADKAWVHCERFILTCFCIIYYWRVQSYGETIRW